MLLAMALAATHAPTVPERRHHILIPSGRLAASLARLSAATGADFIASGDGFAQVTTSAVACDCTTSSALARMLQGTGLAGHAVPSGWRIEQRSRIMVPHIVPAPSGSIAQLAPGEILVTASKQAIPLSAYPGTATIVDPVDLGLDPGPATTEAVVARSAILNATALGPGRNKLFIRGVADSGFSGTSPVTTAQYLDETRLTYNSPDPDLVLYDIRSVEILEGPQGSLYGTGALGGVVRIVTEAPDPGNIAASMAGGVALTAHGAPSSDLSAMANIPIVSDRLAARLVGYRVSDGGYIDNPIDRRDDINAVRTTGGRFALGWTDTAWSIDARIAAQSIRGKDSQWVNGTGSSLDQFARVRQPYRSGFALADIVLHHAMGGIQFTSTSAVTRRSIEENYDASDTLPGNSASTFRQRSSTRMLSHETRLSQRTDKGGGWLIGLGLLSNRAIIQRDFGGSKTTSTPSQLLHEDAVEASLFGEVSLALPLGLVATGGARLAYAHLTDRVATAGGPIGIFDDPQVVVHGQDARAHIRLTPSAALSKRVARDVLFYLRYDEAFRPGGLAISNGVVQHFDSDRLSSLAAGFRIGSSVTPASLSLTLTQTRWRHVQADLVTEGGLPITTNIGDATISGAEVSGRWEPLPGLRLDGSLFANRSRLRDSEITIVIVPRSELPNVARFGASIGASWSADLAGKRLSIDTRWRYIGPSRLGVGPVLGRSQGDIIAGEVALRWGDGKNGFSMRLNNPLDARGNRFALGTPFRLYLPQATPLRPRTVRFGYDERF